MSIRLQSLDTLKYVGASSSWTDMPEQARDFDGGTEALFYCYEHHLKHMRVLGQFDDPEENFTVRLPDFSFGQPAD
jgi:hypothetical protein